MTMSQGPAMPRLLLGCVNPLDANAQPAMSIAEQLCRHGIPVELRPVSRDHQARPEQLWLSHTSCHSGSAPQPGEVPDPHEAARRLGESNRALDPAVVISAVVDFLSRSGAVAPVGQGPLGQGLSTRAG